MKAAILKGLNLPLIVDEVSLPEKLNAGQVLVRVECATICGAQIGEIVGAKGHDKFLPHLLGHEGCGFIEDTGESVKNVKQGDRVVMHWRKGAGIESDFPKYQWGNKIIGGGLVTTFNEYAVVSENRLTRIDNDIPLTVGSLMGCAVTTGLGLINNEAKLKIGQSIMVLGCGGVGLNIIQGAAMVSGNPIIAVDRIKDKLISAEQYGATHLINTSISDLQSEVKKIVNSVDVVVDCTGSVSMINEGLLLTKEKLILVGQPFYDQSLVLPGFRKHYQGKVIMDSQGGLTNPTEDIPKYLELYRNGKLQLDDLITDTFYIDKINDAVNLAQKGTAGRILIKM